MALLTFRRSLALIVLSGLGTLGLVVGISESIGVHLRRELTVVEGTLIPKIEFGPRIEARLAELSRAFQDAVAAQDAGSLQLAQLHRDEILRLLDRIAPAISEADRMLIQKELQEYFALATSVSLRLIRGDAGEETIAAARDMQDMKSRLHTSAGRVLTLDRNALGSAFETARGSSANAGHYQMALGAIGALLLVSLGLWSRRELLHRLGDLSAGITRFATGAFGEKIPETTSDELGLLAREVNKMAENLATLATEREERDWLRARLAELSDSLRGNLAVETVAERVLAFLLDHLGGVASTLYLREGDTLVLTKSLALGGESALSVSPPRTFGVDEGLLGRAFSMGRTASVRDLPADYFKLRSALGESSPREILFFPIQREQEPFGIVELALLNSPSARARELLSAVDLLVSVTFEAAQSRSAVDRLLSETQEQANRLVQQEEELRLSNQELLLQQQELRGANEALKDQQQSLSERNQELDRARERLQEKAEELGRVSLFKSQFLANMSHELRTPLNSMLLLSKLLADNEAGHLTNKQVEWCATIHSAGQDLLSLINQVLDLSKIEAGKAEAEVEEVRLADLALMLQRRFEPLAYGRRLKLEVESEAGVPSIWSDRLRIERIITNLLGNAIKFTEVGGVKLWIGEPDPRIYPIPEKIRSVPLIAFSVIDTGIGIRAEELERVFVPFEQVDSSSARRYQGTGLGLAIARESAELLGGAILVESTHGVGSRFTLVIPIGDPSAAQASRQGYNREIADDRAELAESEPHILVIEDDPTLSEQLVEAIHSRPLKAIVATTGEEGLRLAKKHLPLGIVLDVKLPDIDGWTVMERLRETPETSRIPVHFLSALDAPEGGLSRGAVGYLTKPATREQLREVIRHLSPPPQTSGRILVIEDNGLEGTSVVALLEEAGYDATHVRSAKEARTALQSEYFDCALLDLGLPDMDGLQFLETIRELPETKSTRVIVHTGRSLEKAETRRLEAYAQAIVLKDGQSGARLLEEIRLFAHHVQPEPGSRLEPGKSEGVPGSTSLDGVKVLLVEDDIRTVYAISALLQSRGCQVEVAENGREALEKLESGKLVDCVLMDIMMPEMDGYEATKRIREKTHLKGLPIIALTAKAMVEERERCLAAGATDYLSKPVESGALLRKVSHWVRKEGLGGVLL